MNRFNQTFIQKVSFSFKIQGHVTSFSEDTLWILKAVNVQNPLRRVFPDGQKNQLKKQNYFDIFNLLETSFISGSALITWITLFLRIIYSFVCLTWRSSGEKAKESLS